MPGADDPDIQRILAEFKDVLFSEIPGGLPPTRYAADGSAIEHTIETAPDVQPFSRPPRPFTAEDHEAVKKYLADFVAKGWIKPSLSPWAAPVLFVPKKADPVTGKRSLRMVISFVKLNSKTLNKIAYRLPHISDLLTRMLGARYFSKLDLLDGYYQVRMKSEDIPKTASPRRMVILSFVSCPWDSVGLRLRFSTSWTKRSETALLCPQATLLHSCTL